MTDELNKHGIFIGDVFILNYCGIKVLFQVCKTTKNSVFLVELATKRYKDGIMLTKSIKASKNPLIINKDNTHTHSTYEVVPIKLEKDYWLPIEIKPFSKIHIMALQRNGFEYAPTGYAYAVPVKEYYNRYWTDSTEPIGLA